MLHHYRQNRGLLAVRGVIAILFSLVAFAYPLSTLSVLVMFFGAFVLVDGIFAVMTAFRAPSGDARTWLMLEGGLGVLVGLYALFAPPAAVATLILMAAAWAIMTGIFQIITAIQLRREITNEWTLLLGGIASIALGILLVAVPGVGALAWAYMIAAYALISGISLLILAMRMHRDHHGHTPMSGNHPTHGPTATV